MTIRRSEVDFEPEGCIPSHQIRQSGLLCLFCVKNRRKNKSKASQRGPDLKGVPLAAFQYSEVVVAGEVRFTTSVQARWCKGHPALRWHCAGTS